MRTGGSIYVQGAVDRIEVTRQEFYIVIKAVVGFRRNIDSVIAAVKVKVGHAGSSLDVDRIAAGAEVDIDLVDTDEGWSPYLSLDDAQNWMTSARRYAEVT